eukprot:m.213244 g.213244  ORF g.213244 m.213244 type:complete len:293 (-) comp13789_c0_seq11:2662-3540(-)
MEGEEEEDAVTVTANDVVDTVAVNCDVDGDMNGQELKGRSRGSSGIKGTAKREFDCECEYFRRYEALMLKKPKDVNLFSHPNTSDKRRKELITWLRSTEEESPLKLQVLFAFSVPTMSIIQELATYSQANNISRWISCGSGSAYWESLMESFGLSLLCFDQNTLYPKDMHHTHVQTGGPDIVAKHSTSGDALFLAWPDDSEDSVFGRDCVMEFNGNTIVHVGELFGETLSETPYGQSTSKQCQEALAKDFRIYKRISLPQWPYQRDSLTIWRRTTRALVCDDVGTRYLNFVQ